jgi:hypothetical protein
MEVVAEQVVFRYVYLYQLAEELLIQLQLVVVDLHKHKELLQQVLDLHQ